MVPSLDPFKLIGCSRARSLTRQSAFVRSHPLLQASKDFSGNDRILLASNDARNRRGLSFNTCRDLFSDRTARFVLSASASCCKSHHAKSNDVLCIETKLHGLKGQREPWIEHGTPIVGAELVDLWRSSATPHAHQAMRCSPIGRAKQLPLVGSRRLPQFSSARHRSSFPPPTSVQATARPHSSRVPAPRS
jgi:hypothetical protein